MITCMRARICSDLSLCEDQTVGTLHPKVLSFALPQSSPQPGPKLHSWFRAHGVYEGSSQEGPQRDPVKSGATHGFEVLPFLRTHVYSSDSSIPGPQTRLGRRGQWGFWCQVLGS